MKKNIEEFIFLRDKLKEIAVAINNEELIEASFLTGCLHSICHENALYFQGLEDIKNIKPKSCCY